MNHSSTTNPILANRATAEAAGLDVEQAVRTRYSAASQSVEPSLCCPVRYDQKHLDVLPDELVERDYGCGDPSRYVQPGETVLDLGSGGGKICYIASQVVGPEGRVIGVDVNDDMLGLARKYQREIGNRIGWHNVQFHKGRIQDLALDLEQFDRVLRNSPISSADDWLAGQRIAADMRREQPMIATESIDVVVSNCVLNLVAAADRRQLFEEVFRVLRRSGRAAISDIVCDEAVPDRLRNDPQLWSGCLSGAFVECEFLEAFERAGFHGMEIVDRQTQPWATIAGIEFRSMTVQAFKGQDGPCLDQRHAVIYNGPWKSVTDDDGHVLPRGVRSAVCGKLFERFTRPPYASNITPVPPREPVPPAEATRSDCRHGAVRDPQETKSGRSQTTDLPIQDDCGPTNCC